ncbi:MAG: uroporphyrinogen-III synthase [Candidatus Deferrimicrobiaceae bacterium]
MSLQGKRILVTRGEDQAEEFSSMIRKRGGVPVMFPTVRLVPPDDPSVLDEALARLGTFDWVLFTSANAARLFLERAAKRGIRGIPEGVRVASVGPGTTREVQRQGFPVHLEAKQHTAEGMVGALAGEGFAGKRFLLPRAQEGREVLPLVIGRRGGTVDVVTAYRNGLAPRDEKAAKEIGEMPPDVCTFASPSAFRNFFLLLGEERAASVLSRSRIAVIGEVTRRAVEERNYLVDIMPETFTLAGMLEAIERHFASPPRGRESS